MYPQWSPNGRELFYLDWGKQRIIVADYTATNRSFSSSKPRVWSGWKIRAGGVSNFALAPDGKYFAVFSMPDATPEDKGPAEVTPLLNVFDELRRRAPVGY